MKNLHDFFAFARERENIRLRKQYLAWPWTKDPVLQTYRFCNVFREDDTTTKWFRENIRDKVKHDRSRALMATVAFRWFNLIATGEKIKDILVEEGWNQAKVKKRLAGAKPIITGAYMIKSPPGMNKLEGLSMCIEAINKDKHRVLQSYPSLRDYHSALSEFPYMGPFMAYEVVTDLRHTCLLSKAEDVLTWASAGPGCARGLGWVIEDDPERYGYNSQADQVLMLDHMQTLLKHAWQPSCWPADWRSWEMREVEHVLCEYDKVRRGKLGQSLKRKYKR